MQNLILQNFNPAIYQRDNVFHLSLSTDDYLRVITGRLIKVDRRTSNMVGAKFKLQHGKAFGYFYLYAVVDRYGYFTSTIF